LPALALALVVGGALGAGWIVSSASGGPSAAAPPSRAPEKPLSEDPPVARRDAREGRRAWDEVRSLAPERQVLAAEIWLQTYPDQPDEERARVETFLAREGALRPLQVLGSHAPLVLRTGTFVGPERLLTWGEGVLTEWELGRDDPVSELRLSSGARVPVILALPNGDVVLGSPDAGLIWLRGEARVSTLDVRPVSLACSPDGRLLAAGGRGRIALFDVETQGLRWVAGEGARDYLGLCFDRDGERLLASQGETGYERSSEDVLELYDVRGGEPLWELPTEGLARIIVRLPDSEQLLLGYNRGAIEVWDLEQRRAVAEFEPQGASGEGFLSQRAVVGSVRGLAFSPGGEILYAVCSGEAGDFNQIAAFGLLDRRGLRAPLVREPWVYGCQVSGDGRYLAVATGRGVVEVWSTRGLR
jgi:hypothetical protein